MRLKIVVLLATVLILVWLGYSALVQRQNSQLASDLSRRLDVKKNGTASGSKRTVNMIRLGNLTAERDPINWIVRDSKTDAFLNLPFQPSIDGEVSFEQTEAVAHQSDNPGFVGPQACAECHRERHETYVETGHYRTSTVADATAGSFAAPENELQSSQGDLRYTMLEKEGRVFQRISFDQWSQSVPMDIRTGSGKVGHTYLYWLGEALFQNHVSYYSATNEWIPSPGFNDFGGTYSRPIELLCLECHVTYIDLTQPPNHYDRQSAIWGVSCERCHGPGRDHVEYHRKHPEQQKAKFIAQPAELSRNRQLDICGQCHSGNFRFESKAFAFRPGDLLIDHHTPHGLKLEKVGSVHTSNQLSRLEKSVCFQQSQMTCSSCHDPHQKQRGDVVEFSQRCLDCHQQAQCGMHDELDQALSQDCISCHMPMDEDVNTEIDSALGRFSPPMIDHHIRIDREATDAFLKAMRKR